jgi:hypothetical protein
MSATVRVYKDVCVWMVGKEAFECERLIGHVCPMCGNSTATVALPPPLLARQTDGTAYVCAPFFGGCNHGFSQEAQPG